METGDLRAAVTLPPGEDRNVWLAVNTVDFFNLTNMLYGSVMGDCTDSSCPAMGAGQDFEYLWVDPPEIPSPVKLSAPQYVEKLMTWIEKKVGDEDLFVVFEEEVGEGPRFPRNFESEVKQIFKRLFRVYAHMYYSHAADIAREGDTAAFNTSYKHFIFFVREFNLIRYRELAPMKQFTVDLIGEEIEEMFVRPRRRKKRRD